MSLQVCSPQHTKLQNVPVKTNISLGYCVHFQAKINCPGDKTCRPDRKTKKLSTITLKSCGIYVAKTLSQMNRGHDLDGTAPGKSELQWKYHNKSERYTTNVTIRIIALS